MRQRQDAVGEAMLLLLAVFVLMSTACSTIAPTEIESDVSVGDLSGNQAIIPGIVIPEIPADRDDSRGNDCLLGVLCAYGIEPVETWATTGSEVPTMESLCVTIERVSGGRIVAKPRIGVTLDEVRKGLRENRPAILKIDLRGLGSQRSAPMGWFFRDDPSPKHQYCIACGEAQDPEGQLVFVLANSSGHRAYLTEAGLQRAWRLTEGSAILFETPALSRDEWKRAQRSKRP